MALKKTDLYSSIWQSCDELRGGMDASQYKDYILTLLFMKYVTDKAKANAGKTLIDVPEGGSFDDMVALKGDPEIGDRINKVIWKLADANDLVGVITEANFNDPEKLGSGREMQDRLSKLVAIFADLDFSGSRAEGDDLLGDAYEYLMRHFATESGKSKGQFYTPAEVSRVMARIVGVGPGTSQDDTVYDPTCGSGSLLLKVAAEAPRGITVYGQEKDNATWALSRMNMILHDDATADIAKGDTITSPKFLTSDSKLRTFDFVVANPPFSQKSWTNGLENDYDRFSYGFPPEKNGDYAFLLHALASLKSTGRGVIVMPHGVLFRGNAEATIRRELLKRGFIRGVIGLPPNLFYGTGIPACLIVLDKPGAGARRDVFMVNASAGFMKDGAKNRLRNQDIHKIVDVFNRQTEVARYSRLVPYDEIASESNDFNLNISRYVDSSEPEDIQDLDAHLHGGIPEHDISALAPFWDAFPSLRARLFTGNRPGYDDLAVDIAEVRQAIVDSPEFQRFQAEVRAKVEEWFAAHRPELEAIGPDTTPNDLITRLGDDLLARFRGTPLLDPYDVYEQLLSYWDETMHDDVFLVMTARSWADAALPRHAIVDKDRRLNETPDLAIGSGKRAKKYKMDLVPPSVVARHYFADDLAELDDLTASFEAASLSVEGYIEEHGVEEGLLVAAVDDDKLTKVAAKVRLNQANKEEGSDPEEIAALEHVIELFDSESASRKAVKSAQAALDEEVLKSYGFDDITVRSLVLDDKWLPTITSRIANTVESLCRQVVGRIGVLAERYDATLAQIDAEVVRLSASAMAQELLAGETRLPGFAEEWERVALKEVVRFSKGSGLPKSDVVAYGARPCIHYGELFTFYGPEIRRVASRTNVAGKVVTSEPFDVLMPTSDVTPRGLAKASAVHDRGVVLGGDILVIRGDRGRVYGPFLAHAIRHDANQVLQLVRGTTVYHLYAADMRNFEVNLPPLEEQKAIAAALWDAGAELEALERRLRKTQAIKQAIAQRLLTCKTALPTAGAVA
jgi:type I restriction enzyme M protein